MNCSDIAISVEGLSKRYQIGHLTPVQNGHHTLRDALGRSVRQFGRSLVEMLHGRQIIQGDAIEEFWALRDVSFQVRRGEVLGIIGRNGAGKSTLLKVLSRITEPSEGRVTIRGRVSSLLEVGTGFHPELTGRENIFLNGAILGMSRREIKSKFDEIVAFAEIDKFLDTPVKRYSSGMYVRLAFAVAAHLEPEILIVDEVLAVGDAEFQKRCLGKMGEVANGGRTVLFVSHNMSAVAALCSRALLLSEGRVLEDGRADEIVAVYLGEGIGRQGVDGRRIKVRASLDQGTYSFGSGVVLRFDVEICGPIDAPDVGFGINDVEGRRIATLCSETAVRLPALGANESFGFTVESEPIRLVPGQYRVKVALAEKGWEVEGYEDAVGLVVPEYEPYAIRPPVRPRGSVFLKPTVTIHKTALVSSVR